jgi:hypothetical protein
MLFDYELLHLSVDTNKYFFKFWKKKICIPRKIQFYYSSWLHIYFLKDSFVGYVYANF